MRKSSMKLITAVAIASLAIVLITFLHGVKDTRYQYESFDRTFNNDFCNLTDTFDLKYNSFYIAGSDKEHFYLANSTAPFHLLIVRTAFKDTLSINVDTRNILNEKYRAFQVKVCPPYFYLTDGFMPLILSGRITDWALSRALFDSAFFVDIEPMTPHTFAIKTLSSRTHEHLLGKMNDTVSGVQLVEGLLEKQIDGVFCTDGEMHYDEETGRLVYVYFYRNQYVVMDSDLNLIERGNTIDSISRARIQVATISSSGVRTMAAPRLVVNKKSCVSGDLLFVHSNIKARNESRDAFDKAAAL
ncbi:MAG TPA: hypothetical protein VK589_02235, partial [Chryseolinea sp.]|nr:hypothetical protein [Chryseolinea sp.]